MTKQSETRFKEQVIEDLKLLKNCWFLKTQEKARRGVPDLLLCVKGNFVAIELKTDYGVVAPLQEHILGKILAAEGLAFVATPETWESQLRCILTISGSPQDEESILQKRLHQ